MERSVADKSAAYCDVYANQYSLPPIVISLYLISSTRQSLSFLVHEAKVVNRHNNTLNHQLRAVRSGASPPSASCRLLAEIPDIVLRARFAPLVRVCSNQYVFEGGLPSVHCHTPYPPQCLLRMSTEMVLKLRPTRLSCMCSYPNVPIVESAKEYKTRAFPPRSSVGGHHLSD